MEHSTRPVTARSIRIVSNQERVYADGGKSSLTLPRIALRIGVTGQRPPKLASNKEAEIRAAIRNVLQFVEAEVDKVAAQSAAYTNNPLLHIISPLAEGADRLVAEEALRLHRGFRLQAPLPASVEEYQLDFPSPKSAAAFNRLLQQASSVFELNGQRAGAWLQPAAYEAVGRLTLAHADLLLAVWDGQSGERGGTAQIVREALQANICTVQIDSQDPNNIHCLSSGEDTEVDWEQQLRDSISQTLMPPENAGEMAREFLKRPVIAAGSDDIKIQQEHADKIAQEHASRYRRAYKTIYWLAPFAVLCAVGGLWLTANNSDALPEWLLPSSELLCIAIIIFLVWWGRHRGRWHERWLDARVLAEQFRAWTFLAPIGQTPSNSRLPPYASPEIVQHDWTGWYLRARVREHGLSSAKLTAAYLEDYRHHLLQLVAQQKAHHCGKAQAREGTYENLERAALALFGTTAAACVTHLILPHVMSVSGERALLPWLTGIAAVTATLPAFGAAFEGLQAQGEYRRLAERAKGMEHHFDSLTKRLEKLEGQSLTLLDLGAIAREASGAMLTETSDWRNLIRIHGLHFVS